MTSETVAGSSSFNEINWTPENEVCLFNAMRGQKPTGKHLLVIGYYLYLESSGGKYKQSTFFGSSVTCV